LGRQAFSLAKIRPKNRQQGKQATVRKKRLCNKNQRFVTMSYFIAAISNGGGAPEQAYRKMQAAGACPEKPFAGKPCFFTMVCFMSIFGDFSVRS
jgi:hypothetical protein